MTTIDTSRIPRLAERHQAERLWLAVVEAEQRLSKLDKKHDVSLDAKYQPLFDAIRVRRAQEQHALNDKFEGELRALRRQRDEEESGPELAAAREASSLADKAYTDLGMDLLTTSGYGEDPKIVRCALSGVPLFEDDEIMEDPETGEAILRCLVLPPRPAEDEECEEAA